VPLLQNVNIVIIDLFLCNPFGGTKALEENQVAQVASRLESSAHHEDLHHVRQNYLCAAHQEQLNQVDADDGEFYSPNHVHQVLLEVVGQLLFLDFAVV